MPRQNQWSRELKEDYVTALAESLDILSEFVGYYKINYSLAVLKVQDVKRLALLLGLVVDRLHAAKLIPPPEK